MIDRSLVRIDIFVIAISSILKNNLSEYLIDTIANMLALNYAANKLLRDNMPNFYEYADLCAARIKNHLGHKVFLDETFEAALELFAIALTDVDQNSNNLADLSKIFNKETLTEIVASIAMPENDLSNAELKELEEVIDAILQTTDAENIINFIVTQPEVIKSIIKRKGRKLGGIIRELSEASNNASKISSLSADFAQLAGLVLSASLALVGNMLVIHNFSSISAAAIVPVSVAILKLAPKLGEIVGGYIAQYEPEYQQITQKFSGVMEQLTNSMSINAVNDIDIKSQNIEFSKINVHDITQNVKQHVNVKATEKNIGELPGLIKDRHIKNKARHAIDL